MSGAFLSVLVVIVAVTTSFLTLKFNGPIINFLWQYTHSNVVKPGCNPVSSIGKVKLHYFAERGRAEPIKMLLTLGGIPYEEVNFDQLTWPEQKARGIQSGLYPFGQVPAIETSTGVKLAQTLAIARYVARATGLDCDCETIHYCDMMAQATEDMRKVYYKTVYNPEFSVADRENYFSAILPQWLNYLDVLAPSRQGVENYLNERLTWVDVLVFEIVDMNLEFYNMQLSPNQTMVDILKDYPRLNNVYRALHVIRPMRNYRNDPNRFPLKLPYPPKDAAKTES